MIAMKQLVAVATFVTSVACGPVPAPPKELVSQIGVAMGGKPWSGTITVKRTANGQFNEPRTVIHSSTTAVSLNHLTELTVTKNQASGKITYDLKESTVLKDDYDWNVVDGTIVTETIASGVQPATFNVTTNDDGTYQIEYAVPGVVGRYTKTETSTVTCKPGKDPECRDSHSSNTDTAQPHDVGYEAGSVQGQINKAKPDSLSGSSSEPYEYSPNVMGRAVVTWSLSR